MFVDEGIPVWDADAAVRELYAPGGAAVAPTAELCPDALDGEMISREMLNAWIAREPDAIKRLEAVVHPLVAARRRAFLESVDAPIVVLDIPLLFETGGHTSVDKVVVVSAPEDLQRSRALERPGMTPAQLDLILARQVPDAEKRARADLVIDTRTRDGARRQVQSCLADLKKELANA
jgi:dephospho-CoA kinase